MPSSESDGGFDPNEAPDARDGLTRAERIALVCMRQAEEELNGRNVPTAMLYGRFVEHLDIGQDEFMKIVARLTGHGSVD